MKKKNMRLLALLLAAVLALSACGGGNKDDSSGGGETTPPASTGTDTPGTTPAEPSEPAGTKAEPVKDFTTYQTAANEMETFLVFNNEGQATQDVLANCMAGLLEVTPKGTLQPAIATEWGTEDGGLTWTFKLRDDVTWVDVNGNEKAKCTAQDWLTSLEWVLNYHKNDAKNTSMPTQMIAGAQEYYDYTKELDEADAMALTAADDAFRNTVGIEVPDDYTIIYHCCKNVTYFDSLAVAAPLMPLSQAMVDELGVDNVKSMQNTDMWYNGPYLITEFIQGNSKTLTRNEAYYDKDCTLFDSVTVLMVDDALMGQTLFFNGDVDTCSLSESNLHTIYDDANHELRGNLVEDRAAKYSYTIHLNYGKRLEDGTPDVNWNTAIANEAFRQSLYYGLDLTRFWARTNYIHPEKLENVAYTMKNLLYFSDGTDYVEHVWEKIGLPEGKGRYDAVKAQQYKEQAMEELAGKVTFPVQLDHYIKASDQNALDQATVIKEMVEALGTDFITVNIKTFVSSVSKEVYTPQLNSWSFSGWGADYADPENFLGQELYGNDSAYFAVGMSHTNDPECLTDPGLIATLEEFTAMAEAASQIYDDLDQRYDAYAEAEAYFLNHALAIPTYYNIPWQLTKVNVYSKPFAMFGMQNNLYKNWETSEEPYTTEQYAAFEAAFNG
jgi:oligopeptide transport system substrate-binding protein